MTLVLVSSEGGNDMSPEFVYTGNKQSTASLIANTERRQAAMKQGRLPVEVSPGMFQSELAVSFEVAGQKVLAHRGPCGREGQPAPGLCSRRGRKRDGDRPAARHLHLGKPNSRSERLPEGRVRQE